MWNPRTVAQLSGAGAGALAAALLFVDTQRLIWRSAADNCRSFGTFQPLNRNLDEETFLQPKTRALAVRSWNSFVDSTLGALATELARRGM
jgi:hypothetical protein